MWAVWFSSMDQTSVYRALRVRPIMECQLHCLDGFLFSYENLKHNKQRLSHLNNGTMCRGSNVKDMIARSFQLESLILAQNERWRHA